MADNTTTPDPKGRKIVGIDLGTTFSCIAHIDEHDKPETLLNDDNQPTTASAVMIEDKDNIVVGQIAKDHSVDSPERVATLFKKIMGRGLKPSIGGTEYPTEELSAMVLKKLKQDAERRMGQTITDAVITVPAWFGADARKATQDAGEMAGFTVHRILDEPVAAALAYGFSNPAKAQTLLVYDLGGGTFDITLFKIKPPAQGNIPEIEMISTGGNHDLGGSNWDEKLVEFVAGEFMTTHGETANPCDDLGAKQDLTIKCEKAKINLSKRPKERIVCQHDGKSLTVELTAERMDELTEHLVDLTSAEIDNLLSDKEYTPDMIDKVLLAGGSTRLKSVRSILEKKFPGKVDGSLDADQCVAHGAAWMGYLLSKGGGGGGGLSSQGPGSIVLVSSHAIGVVARNEKDELLVNPLIVKDQPLPAEQEDIFFSHKADQTTIAVPICECEARSQDERLDPELCRSLGNVVITGLPAGRPAGQPVSVKLKLDGSARLSVEAVDVSSGIKVTGEFDIGSGLDAKAKAATAKRMGEIEIKS